MASYHQAPGFPRSTSTIGPPIQGSARLHYDLPGDFLLYNILHGEGLGRFAQANRFNARPRCRLPLEQERHQHSGSEQAYG